ncbi:DUF2274 domain-containing protein [Sphingomonas adhaesiva]|uniref:DUF2274 domain-containing protein n=1 Tax=Sphingomonas adhaesiva TaxID=28212 RepID=UPI003FA6AD25
MSEKLRLGPLPKAEMVRLTVTLPAKVKANLDRYAELYAAAYGEPVDAIALVPHMLATFMERDRVFRKAAQAGTSARTDKKGSLATSAAISSTRETAGDTSPSR